MASKSSFRPREAYSFYGKSLFFYRLSTYYPYMKRMKRRALEMLDLQRGLTVLDLACGPGTSFKDIKKRIGPEGMLIGVDCVEEMITLARKNVKKKEYGNIRLIKRDAAALKLASGSIDRAICVNGLSAIKNHEEAIKNVYDALKKNGLFVVVDAKKPETKNCLLRIFLYFFRWKGSYEEKELVESIKKVFGEVHVEEYFYKTCFVAAAKKK